MIKNYLRLGVNIDHVATIRNARGGVHPDPVNAANIAYQAGADGITAHLREDRRHISDRDIERLIKEVSLPLNLEMAPTEEMLDIALKHKPNACCLVPEKRLEVTTEGGLDLLKNNKAIHKIAKRLKDAGIRLSLFIDPDKSQIEKAQEIGADIIEIHTGAFARSYINEKENYLSHYEEIDQLSVYANSIGLEVHAGHGLSYDTVSLVARIAVLKELNIGHFIIGESVFDGLDCVIRRMRAIINNSRKEIS